MARDSGRWALHAAPGRVGGWLHRGGVDRADGRRAGAGVRGPGSAPASLAGWTFDNVSGQVVNLAVPVVGLVLASRRPRLHGTTGEPAQTHILPVMPDWPPDAVWLKLGAEPGLCRACRHAKLNGTRRGTAYLRCTRAAWDTSLSRYPRLPVTLCAGFERREGKP